MNSWKMKSTIIVSIFLLLSFPIAEGLSVMKTDSQQPPPEKKQKVEDVENSLPDSCEKTERLSPWLGRWSEKRIGFHLSDVNKVLKDHVTTLIPPEVAKDVDAVDAVCTNKRVFVPLCGKSVDMPFLTTYADEVVGVEGIRLAFEQFMEEHPDLDVKPAGEVDGFEKFAGKKISLLKGDFFELNDTIAGGKFGAVYDRASLVAIEPNLRQKYADVISSLIAPGGRILLVVLERQGEEEAMKNGPPFSIPRAVVDELFKDRGWVESIELLSVTDQFEERPEDGKRYEGLDKLLETTYLIQAK